MNGKALTTKRTKPKKGGWRKPQLDKKRSWSGGKWVRQNQSVKKLKSEWSKLVDLLVSGDNVLRKEEVGNL